MGGAIEWTALDVVVEMLGIQDVEVFVAELVALREFQKREQ